MLLTAVGGGGGKREKYQRGRQDFPQIPNSFDIERRSIEERKMK